MPMQASFPEWKTTVDAGSGGYPCLQQAGALMLTAGSGGCSCCCQGGGTPALQGHPCPAGLHGHNI